MGAIHATYIGSRIVPDVPPNWPEGTRLVIAPNPEPPVSMMRDEEQGDDPESIARWLEAFDSIPVATTSPMDDPGVLEWRKAMRQFNAEAMRKQMQEPTE